MSKKFVIKVDEETKKCLVARQDRFKELTKRITGKEQKIPLTKVLKISVKNPIELNAFEETFFARGLKKRGYKL